MEEEARGLINNWIKVEDEAFKIKEATISDKPKSCFHKKLPCPQKSIQHSKKSARAYTSLSKNEQNNSKTFKMRRNSSKSKTPEKPNANIEADIELAFSYFVVVYCDK